MCTRFPWHHFTSLLAGAKSVVISTWFPVHNFYSGLYLSLTWRYVPISFIWVAEIYKVLVMSLSRTETLRVSPVCASRSTCYQELRFSAFLRAFMVHRSPFLSFTCKPTVASSRGSFHQSTWFRLGGLQWLTKCSNICKVDSHHLCKNPICMKC
jgi:hypothetical protein